MDCHVFRRLCDELAPFLVGARVEKIHQPADDLVQIAVYARHQKRYLVCRTGRKTPFLMLSAHKLTVGGEPPAAIMRLRKHLADRRIVEVRVDWPERALWLRVKGADEALRADGESASPVWLECHLRDGVRLHLAVSDTLPAEEMPSPWPDEAELADCALHGVRPETWRRWPVLTPALRRTLAALSDPEEGAAERGALLGDLQWGGGDLFVYEDAAGERELFAWPLPPALRGERTETVFEQALAAAAQVGEQEVLAQVAAARHSELAKPHKAEAARLERLLAKLTTEETRLTAMEARRSDAMALQAELYRFAPEAKAAFVELGTPPRRLALDPRLTVRDNMAALFHQAARGRRGLAMLSPRREAVQQAKEAAERAGQGLLAGVIPVPNDRSGAAAKGHSAAPSRGAGHGGDGRGSGKAALPKNVQAFRSSDGFTLLRGRDARGNALLLKLGAPHDLWLHTGLGAGAHVLIRRDHAAREVPERTLHEAAALAVNKSVFRDAARADVMLAEVRYVRPMKGAKTGMVRIDKQLPTLSVVPDPELETTLVV